MFIGHWAPALIVGAVRKKPGLATLFIAAQLIDWLFFGFLLLGWEHMRITPGISAMNPMDLYDMPASHSLKGTLGFALVYFGLVWLLTKDRTAGVFAAAVVVSHWLLDLLVHIPDLTITGSPPKLGLGLWNYPWIEIPLELGITFGALWYYQKKRRPAEGRVYALGLALLILQAVNWFGPVASEVTIGTSLLAFFAFGIVTLLALWMGKSARKVPHTG